MGQPPGSPPLQKPQGQATRVAVKLKRVKKDRGQIKRKSKERPGLQIEPEAPSVSFYLVQKV
jgi:hypothetical protein